MAVKIRIGEAIRNRYLIVNHTLKTSSGDEAQQIIISGSEMLWRKEVICQRNGAHSNIRMYLSVSFSPNLRVDKIAIAKKKTMGPSLSPCADQSTSDG